MKYRNPSDKTLVLVTDEPLRARPRQGRTPQGRTRADLLQSDLKEIIQQAIDMGIKISIIAIDDNLHKLLAKETNGVWFPIPQPSD